MPSLQLTGDRLTVYNVAVICCLGLGSVCFGYTSSIIGTLLGQPSFREYFDLDTRSDSTSLTSSMNGIFQAGACVGTIAEPWVADKWGRRWGLVLPAVLVLVSGAVMAGSTNVIEFIVFRFFAGAGAYMANAATPLMMSELVPTHLRGGLVEFHGIFFQTGYLSASWIGFGTFFWDNNINTWRLSVAIQCIWPTLLLLCLYFCPESPRWLLMQDRVEEAQKVLERLHPQSDEGRVHAAKELYQIRMQADLDRRLGSSWKHIFSKPSYRKRMYLGCGTALIAQFSGVLVLNNYGTVIYKLLSYDSERQLLFQASWLTAGFACMLAGPFIVDRLPRNWLMGMGIIGCSVLLSVIAALIANFVPSTNAAALRATLAMFFLYQPFFIIGLDGTQFIYLGEIFPNHLRAKGICAATTTIAAINIVWLQAAETALENIGWKYFLVFITTSFVGGIIMIKYWPDTRFMPLEEISAIFGDEDEVAIEANQIDMSKVSAVTHSHIENV